MNRIATFAVAFLAVCIFVIVPAYAQVGTANLSGTIRDDQGNPLPSVTVTARNSETGLERTDITSEAGQYRIPSLPFGIYDITAQIQGFATQVQKAVRLDVGRTNTIDFGMKLSATAETMEISGEAPLIEKTESHIATVVTPEQVQSLPLNGRQFANLAALSPGTTLTVHPDPTRPTNLAVSLIGGSGRNLNVNIDGGDNTDDTVGGTNQFFSLESIAEFTFLSNRYKAEYGRSSGGVLNVVTKSGTNTVHGSFFSLFRDDSLNSESQTEKNLNLSNPSPYSREQFGGSVGGPIVKDKAHYFVALERSQADQGDLIDTGGIEPSLDGTFFNVPTRDTLGTVKFTSNIDPKQFLTVRYGQQKTTTVYPSGPNYAPNSRGNLLNTFHSLLASHNYVLSGDKLNEFTFQYADFHNQIFPNSNDPTEIFSNYVYIGQSPNIPQTTDQKKYQFKDDFSWSRGAHHFKTGLNFVHEPTLGGTFSIGVLAPQYYYIGENRESHVFLIQQFSGVFEENTGNNQTGVYFQDDWNVNRHLTLNVGLRYDIVTGLGIDQSTNPLFQAVHAAAQTYDYSWLEPFRNSTNGSIQMDKNNFAPRLGAAYDLKGDGTTVLRGGWGLYYDFPYSNANLLFPLAVLHGYGLSYQFEDDSGIKNADGTYFVPGDPLPPNQGGVSLPREVLSPNWKVPYTQQASVGMSHLVGTDGALDVDYIHAAVRDQYIRFKFNGRPVPGGPRMLGTAFGAFTSAPRMYTPLGYSDYNGLNVSYRHRLTKSFQFQGSYTLSKVTGNLLPGSDEFRLGSPSTCTHCALDFKLGPKDDPRMKGPLNTDARHRIVLSGIVELPAEFQVTGFFRARSARPYNAFDPTNDANGDGLLYDTPDPHVNDRVGAKNTQLDLRIVKIFHIKQSLQVQGILEIFNVFNSDNPDLFRGDLSSSRFGTPVKYAGDAGNGEQRLAQLGFRIEF